MNVVIDTPDVLNERVNARGPQERLALRLQGLAKGSASGVDVGRSAAGRGGGAGLGVLAR